MPLVDVLGKQAHYREWGNGEQAILMLHGWPADSTHYAELGPALARLGWRVIVPDLPGWGQTPPPPSAWAVTDYMRWTHAFAQALHLGPFFLFGHSFGGRIAIKYVLQYPYDVRAIILCAAAGIKPNPYTVKRRVLYVLAKIGNTVFSLPGLRTLSPLARKLLYKMAGSNDYMKAQGVMKETIVRVLGEDLTPLLPEIKHPALVLWGSADGATPLKDGQEMARLMPRSTLHVFAGLRHNLPKLAPGPVAEQIQQFAATDEVRAISEPA